MRTRTAAGAIAIAVVAVGTITAVRWRTQPPGPPPAVAPPRIKPAITPKPMNSPAFSRALEGVLEMEPDEAARLEQQLAAHPDDFTARVKWMAYLRRADRETIPGERAKRWHSAMWLIRHQPDSEILHSYVAQFSARDLQDEAVRQAELLWESAVHDRPGDTARLWNAAWFFRELNDHLYLSYLEATAEADPNHPHALLPLAELYARALMTERHPLAARARRGLERSNNAWVLRNTAYFLEGRIDQTLMAEWKPRTPEQDRIEAAKQQTRFEMAEEKIRRLGVDSFPQLPAVVAEVLRSRGCTVPQPADGPTANVIRGQFVAPGEDGWAVLCSVNRTSSILVFRNDSDRQPQALSTSEDHAFLQGTSEGRFGYSRQIAAVNRDFILRHYRAYGGEKPPPIDQHGIDDAFLGKASVTWYYYQGKWKALQGAD